MTSKALMDSLNSGCSRKLVTPSRLSLAEGLRRSSGNSKRRSVRKLYTAPIEVEQLAPKRQSGTRRSSSVASVNATLGNASTLEESLSVIEKTPDEVLYRTTSVTQAGLSRQISALGVQHNAAGVSHSSVNKVSESKSINNLKPLPFIPSFHRSNSENSSNSSPEINFRRQKINSPVYSCTPPNRVLSSARGAITPSLSGHKTPGSNPRSSYNDSPLSVKMLRTKHEALNALQNTVFANSDPQVSGISKLQKVAKGVNGNKDINQEQTVQDLPATQPATTVLMQGVIAFVDVRNGGDNRSEAVKSHLRELGATVLDKFTKEITHVVFMDGLMSTYKKAVQRKIPLVSVLWIEACKDAMGRVPESLYPPHQMEKYESPDPLKKYRRERSFQPVPNENVEDWLEKCRLKRRKKRLVVEEKENEEIPLPEVLRNRPAWLDGNLEQALRSIADVGPEYDEYINRSTSPTLSEEESFDTPLAVRLMRKIRRDEERNLQNAVPEKNVGAVSPEKRICAESEEPGMSKEKQIDAVNVETPRRLTKGNVSRKSICFSSKDSSFDSEHELPTSPTLESNLSTAIQKCIKSLNKSNALQANGVEAAGRMELTKMSKSDSTIVNDHTANKRNSHMELTPDIRNKQVEVSEPSTSDTTKLSCDVSVCSLTGSRARILAKRKLMPLTQPEVLEGDISEDVAPSQCPYNLDPPKTRKRKRLKSPEEEANNPKRRSIVSNVNVSQKVTVANPRNSLADFVLDTNKPKKALSNVVVPVQTMVGTGLHTPQLELIAAVIEKLGGFELVPKVVSSTTHVIVPGPRRTVNLLKGMVRGCWIVTQEWVLRSLEAGHWIEEDPFELTAFSPAVRENRVARLSLGPRYKNEIFKECGAMYVSHSSKPPKADLEDLITLCGGKLSKTVHRALLIVGKGLRKKHACSVQETWILDCITFNELKPLEQYSLESTAVSAKANKKRN